MSTKQWTYTIWWDKLHKCIFGKIQEWVCLDTLNSILTNIRNTAINKWFGSFPTWNISHVWLLNNAYFTHSYQNHFIFSNAMILSEEEFAFFLHSTLCYFVRLFVCAHLFMSKFCKIQKNIIIVPTHSGKQVVGMGSGMNWFRTMWNGGLRYYQCWPPGSKANFI